MSNQNSTALTPESLTESGGISKQEFIEMYLDTRYTFRFNTVKGRPEYKEMEDTEFKALTDYKLNSIKRELALKKINTSAAALKETLISDFSPRIDPIKEYILNLPPWEGADYIKELCATVKTNNQAAFTDLFTRWMVGTIANALDDSTCKNHLCLVITGEQGRYKTTWLENLCPKPLLPYLFTGKINPQHKDTQTFIAEFFLINIDDQLRQINKQDENELKNLITLNSVKYRRPYGHMIEEFPHKASFCASVNGNDFLTDITGSRRFLPFEAQEIDINKAQSINMDLVYAQAYQLYKESLAGSYIYWITFEEIDTLHKRNEAFRLITIEEELLIEYYSRPASVTDATHFLTTSSLKAKIEDRTKQKLSIKKLGEALTKLQFSRVQRRDIEGRPYVWAVRENSDFDINYTNTTIPKEQ